MRLVERLSGIVAGAASVVDLPELGERARIEALRLRGTLGNILRVRPRSFTRRLRIARLSRRDPGAGMAVVPPKLREAFGRSRPARIWRRGSVRGDWRASRRDGSFPRIWCRTKGARPRCRTSRGATEATAENSGEARPRNWRGGNGDGRVAHHRPKSSERACAGLGVGRRPGKTEGRGEADAPAMATPRGAGPGETAASLTSPKAGQPRPEAGRPWPLPAQIRRSQLESGDSWRRYHRLDWLALGPGLSLSAPPPGS